VAEVKSQLYTDTGSYNELMVNDTLLDIQSASCTEGGGCTGNYAEYKWPVATGSVEDEFKIWTYLYDEAMNGIGYTYINKWYKTDFSDPSTTDDSDTACHSSDQTITLTPSDSRSGVALTTYCIDTAGTCNPSTSGTSVSVTCTAGSYCEKYVRYRSEDNVGNVEAVKASNLVKIDKAGPNAPTGLNPPDNNVKGRSKRTDWIESPG